MENIHKPQNLITSNERFAFLHLLYGSLGAGEYNL